MSRNASTCKLHCSDVLASVVAFRRPEVLTSGLRWLPDALSDFVTLLGLTQRAPPTACRCAFSGPLRRAICPGFLHAGGRCFTFSPRREAWRLARLTESRRRKRRGGEYRSRGSTLHETHRRADHPKRSERLTSASIRVSASRTSGFAIISFDARACCAREKGVAVSPCGKASPPDGFAERAGAPRGFLRRGDFGSGSNSASKTAAKRRQRAQRRT